MENSQNNVSIAFTDLLEVDELDLLRFSFELAGFPAAPLIEEEVVILLLLRFVDEDTGLRRLPVEPKLLAATTRLPERESTKKKSTKN